MVSSFKNLLVVLLLASMFSPGDLVNYMPFDGNNIETNLMSALQEPEIVWVMEFSSADSTINLGTFWGKVQEQWQGQPFQLASVDCMQNPGLAATFRIVKHPTILCLVNLTIAEYTGKMVAEDFVNFLKKQQESAKGGPSSVARNSVFHFFPEMKKKFEQEMKNREELERKRKEIAEDEEKMRKQLLIESTGGQEGEDRDEEILQAQIAAMEERLLLMQKNLFDVKKKTDESLTFEKFTEILQKQQNDWFSEGEGKKDAEKEEGETAEPSKPVSLQSAMYATEELPVEQDKLGELEKIAQKYSNSRSELDDLLQAEFLALAREKYEIENAFVSIHSQVETNELKIRETGETQGQRKSAIKEFEENPANKKKKKKLAQMRQDDETKTKEEELEVQNLQALINKLHDDMARMNTRHRQIDEEILVVAECQQHVQHQKMREKEEYERLNDEIQNSKLKDKTAANQFYANVKDHAQELEVTVWQTFDKLNRTEIVQAMEAKSVKLRKEREKLIRQRKEEEERERRRQEEERRMLEAQNAPAAPPAVNTTKVQKDRSFVKKRLERLQNNGTATNATQSQNQTLLNQNQTLSQQNQTLTEEEKQKKKEELENKKRMEELEKVKKQILEEEKRKWKAERKARAEVEVEFELLEAELIQKAEQELKKREEEAARKKEEEEKEQERQRLAKELRESRRRAKVEHADFLQKMAVLKAFTEKTVQEAQMSEKKYNQQMEEYQEAMQRVREYQDYWQSQWLRPAHPVDKAQQPVMTNLLQKSVIKMAKKKIVAN